MKEALLIIAMSFCVAGITKLIYVAVMKAKEDKDK